MRELRSNPTIPEEEFVGAPIREAQGAAAKAGAIAQALPPRPHHLPVGMADWNKFMQGIDDSRFRAGDPRQVK